MLPSTNRSCTPKPPRGYSHGVIGSCCLALVVAIAPARAAASPVLTRHAPADAAALNAQVRQLLPATLALLQTVETMAIARGRVLTREEMQTARQLGVAEPERVRVLVTPVLPSWLAPDVMANGVMANGVMASGLMGGGASGMDAASEGATAGHALANGAAHPSTGQARIPPERHYGVAGITAGHGILLGIRYANNPRVLTHELAHVAQYERLGTRAFATRYLTELLSVGYFAAPLELEADVAMRRVLTILKPGDAAMTNQTRN